MMGISSVQEGLQNLSPFKTRMKLKIQDHFPQCASIGPQKAKTIPSWGVMTANST
jgi:hypothetical protein